MFCVESVERKCEQMYRYFICQLELHFLKIASKGKTGDYWQDRVNTRNEHVPEKNVVECVKFHLYK